jgi:hypothetical protein
MVVRAKSAFCANLLPARNACRVARDASSIIIISKNEGNGENGLMVHSSAINAPIEFGFVGLRPSVITVFLFLFPEPTLTAASLKASQCKILFRLEPL